MTPLRPAGIIVAACVLASLFAIPAARAQKTAARAAPGVVVVYRCTDATGQVTFQNGVRCPKGQKQEVRALQKPAAPAPRLAGATTAPIAPAAPTGPNAAPIATPATGAPVIANPDAAPGSLPPPPLYRCHAFRGNSYLSEDDDPKERCVALKVGDLSGSQNRSGAQACEMQRDHCERIPDAQLCEAWSQYDRQAESLVALDNPELAAKAQALRGRTRKVMTATTCAAPAAVGAQNP